MVLDFGDIKKLLMELHDMWDHGLILEKADPLLSCFANLSFTEPHVTGLGLGKIFITACAPTAENLAMFAFQYLEDRLHGLYPNGAIHLESLTFFETPTSSATIARSNLGKYKEQQLPSMLKAY